MSSPEQRLRQDETPSSHFTSKPPTLDKLDAADLTNDKGEEAKDQNCKRHKRACEEQYGIDVVLPTNIVRIDDVEQDEKEENEQTVKKKMMRRLGKRR